MGKRRNKNVYYKRNKTLRLLGFASYADYLASDLWKQIRLKVLRRDNWRCCACGQRAWEVHHRHYKPEAMLGDNLNPLHSICPQCHRHIEVYPDGSKVKWHNVKVKLRELQKQHGIVPKGMCRNCLKQHRRSGSDYCGTCLSEIVGSPT